MLVPITAGFLNFKSNFTSLLFSIIAGVSSTLLSRIIVGEFGVITVSVGVVASCVFFFGAHYLQMILGFIQQPKKRAAKKFNINVQNI